MRISVSGRFTAELSAEEDVLRNTAERLLGLSLSEIRALVGDILRAQLRYAAVLTSIEEIRRIEINFLETVSRNAAGELKKIGLRPKDCNVTDINRI